MYDVKDMDQFNRLGQLVPQAFDAFVAFDQAVFKGVRFPLKHKELMAVAVALTRQCPQAAQAQALKARAAGATERDLAEATLIAAALRAGGALRQGLRALRSSE